MALSITKDKGQIHSKGGGIIKIQQGLETGLPLTTAEAVDDLGYVAESTFTDKTPLEDVSDETGAVITSEEGNRQVMIQTILMQTDKARLDMAQDVRGKFYRLYKYNGLVDNKHQEIFFTCGKITPQTELKFTGGRLPFEYRASAVASDATFDSTSISLFGAHASSPVTVSAGSYYKIVETA
jgi:hypothetical protein